MWRCWPRCYQKDSMLQNIFEMICLQFRLEEQEVKSSVWSDYQDSFPRYNQYERAVIDCGMEEHYWWRWPTSS